MFPVSIFPGPMCPSIYVPQTLCSQVFCSPIPMFPGSMFPGPMCPSIYVPQTLCSQVFCSPIPMFPGSMFPGHYSPRFLCSPVPMCPNPYVPQYLCSPRFFFEGEGGVIWVLEQVVDKIRTDIHLIDQWHLKKSQHIKLMQEKMLLYVVIWNKICIIFGISIIVKFAWSN